MKNTLHFSLLVITLFLISLSSFSQSNEKTVYPRQLPMFNVLNVDTLTISAKVLEYENFEITLDNINDEEPAKVWILRPFTLQAFRNTFRDYLFPLTKTLPKSSIKDSLIDPIFFNLKASDIAISSYGSQPSAGKLCFDKNVRVKRINHYDKKSKLLNLKAKKNLANYQLINVNLKYTPHIKDSLSLQTQTLMEARVSSQTKENPNPTINSTIKTDTIRRKLYKIDEELYKKKKAKKKLIELYRDDFLQNRKFEYDSTKLELEFWKIQHKVLSKDINSKEERIISLQIEADSNKIKNDTNKEKIKLISNQIDLLNKNIDSLYIALGDSSIKIFDKNHKGLEYKGLEKETISYNKQFEHNSNIIKKAKALLYGELQYFNYYMSRILNKYTKSKSDFYAKQKKGIDIPDDKKSFNQERIKYQTDSTKIRGSLFYLNERSELLTKFQLNLNSHSNLFEKLIALINQKEKISRAIESDDSMKIEIEQKLPILRDSLIIIRDSLINSHKRFITSQNKMPDTDFIVNKIDIEFNRGFIENIIVLGEAVNFKMTDNIEDILNNRVNKAGKEVKFENLSPIGFSRKIDFEDAKNRKLHTRGGEDTQYEIRLEDILTIYIQDHQVDRRDFSPMNGMLTYNSLDKENCKPLYKEETYKIIEATIFSDFVGLDRTEPNGLVQTEISKNIPLITSRNVWKGIPTFIHRRFSGSNSVDAWNFGTLAYFEPILAISKIEDDNKTLQLNTLDRFINNSYAPIKYTSTLKLKQFQNFETGFDLNLALLDMPSFKSTITVDIGTRFGRTLISDTLKTFDGAALQSTNGGVPLEYGVNTYEISHKINWNIKSDERYEFNLSWRKSWLSLRDNRFNQVGNIDTFGNTLVQSKHYNEYHTMQMQAKFKLSNTASGKLFFRYRLHWQRDFWRTGFHQAQVGYSFFLLGRYKE